MKLFLKIVAGCFIAIIISWILVFFLGAGIIGSLSSKDKKIIANNSVLFLDLAKSIGEQNSGGDFDLMSGKINAKIGLRELLKSLNDAKNDDRVSGIYLKCSGNGWGTASLNEFIEALEDFKTSGKFIYAYSDNISEGAYYAVSIADSIFARPYGSFEFNGLSSSIMFYKGLLDKLDIQPEIFYAGQFKSATEPFRATKMSDANKLQMTALLNDLYNTIIGTISRHRNIDTATLKQLAGNNTVQTTEDALKAKLIDVLAYDDEVKTVIGNRVGEKNINDISFTGFADYIEDKAPIIPATSGNIAVVHFDGEIIDGLSDDGYIGGEKFAKIIRDIRLDTSVKALVMRVNSPGGSANACENMWRELDLLKKEKPIVVSMGNYAASGGYYISTVADTIFAQPNTITGSIGVYMMYLNTHKLMNNKLGLTFDGVKTGTYADFPNASRDLTPVEKGFIQSSVDSIYKLFKTRVANGRKINYDDVEAVAQGRVWTGNMAKEIKLVDKIGGLKDAIECARNMAKINEARIYALPSGKSALEKLLSFEDSDDENIKSKVYISKEEMIAKELGTDFYNIYKQIVSLKTTANKGQAMMPMNITIY